MRPSVFAALAAALLAPAALAQTSGVDLGGMDRTVRPQDDLYRYANGEWVRTTEIPADRSRYGTFDVLGDAAERDVRALIADAAAGRVADPDAAKIGAYYTAYMDSSRVEALGLAPLRADLDRVAAVRTADDLVRYFAGNSATFGPSPVGVYVGVDDRNSSRHLVNVVQSGTALPDRSYYLDERFAEARAGYVRYLTTLDSLAAAEGAAGFGGGAATARAVLDLETAIATAQWPAFRTGTPRRPTT